MNSPNTFTISLCWSSTKLTWTSPFSIATIKIVNLSLASSFGFYILARDHMLQRIVNYLSFYRNVLLDLLVLEAKLTVKVSEASFAIMRAWRVRFIYRLGMPAVSIFLIFSLSYATSNFGNLFAEAQSSVTTTQEEQNADEAIQTFQIDGAIGSLVTDLLNSTIRENVSDSQPPLYVVVGNWSMAVVNGEVNYLQVDFIMALENGTQIQVYSIENLENIVIPSPLHKTLD